MSLEKILLMQSSATMAAAVIQNLPDNMPLSVDISAEEVRAGNLMAWELQRIFYHAQLKALADDTNWPTPNVKGGGGIVPGLLDGLNSPAAQALLKGLVPGGDLAAFLAKLIGGAVSPPAPPANIPNPGAATP